jgi:hypothetical protein
VTADYPKFRRAQVERGPYYRGPAKVISFRMRASVFVIVAAGLAIGVGMGLVFVK